ncbi:Carboxypeptidase A1 [Holothuria leucospilota]|uniref:Carboxypeptidase A1 n=1 Tax=Holothuria leucospilota TaxID=206669 RepID=A0A9Q0YBU5_HOLLE|nr:Carboxypeptidase A1 [Holothuria leucospilota]
MRSFFLLICLTVVFAAKDYSGFKVLRVKPPDKRAYDFLKSLEYGFNFWKESRGVGHEADILIPGDSHQFLASKLEELGFDIKVMIEDVQLLIDEQMNTNTTSFDYNIYHTMDEITAWMDDMISMHGDMVSKEAFARTYEGRDVYKMKLLDDYNSSRTDNLIDLMEFHVVPVFNVDGYIFTWEEDRMWRKTRKPNEGRVCVGTDPNRNYDNHWGTSGTNDIPCSQAYMGTRACSEIEIQTMQDHILSIRDRVGVFMDVHAYSEYWMYPYGWTMQTANDYEELNAASKVAVDAIESLYGRNYAYGPISIVIYPASGCSADWAYDNAKIKHSYALELRDTGEYGLLLPASEIQPSSEELFVGCEALVRHLKETSVI